MARLFPERLPGINIVGSAPMINARQVNPKANAGLPGREFDRAVKVTAVVILNRNIAIIPIIGFEIPKIKRGADRTRAETEILIQPNLSDRNPPRAFPRATEKTRTKRRLGFDFQGNTKANPMKDLTRMTSRSNMIINSK